MASANEPARGPDEGDEGYPPLPRARFTLAVLTIAYVVSFIDRQALSLLVEPIRRDLGLSDMQIGLLQGLAFAAVYAIAGLPLGRAADQFSRRNVILAGVAFWSLMTSCCGVARSFGSLLLCRGGVGVGEAALSPACTRCCRTAFRREGCLPPWRSTTLGPPSGAASLFCSAAPSSRSPATSVTGPWAAVPARRPAVAGHLPAVGWPWARRDSAARDAEGAGASLHHHRATGHREFRRHVATAPR